MAFSWANLQARYDLPRMYQRVGATGSVNVTVTVVGLALALSLGTPTVTGSGLALPSGLSAASSVGSATATGSARALPSGVSASASIGAPGVSGSAVSAIAGLSTAGEIGSPTVNGSALSLVTGLPSLSSLGDAIVSGTANTWPDGVSGVSALGDVTVQTGGSGDVTVAPSGVSGTSTLGTVTVRIVNPTPPAPPRGGIRGWVPRPVETKDALAEPVGVRVTLRLGTVLVHADAACPVFGAFSDAFVGVADVQASSVAIVEPLTLRSWCSPVTVTADARIVSSVVPTTMRVGVVVVHPDEDEAEWQRQVAEDDELLAWGVFDA